MALAGRRPLNAIADPPAASSWVAGTPGREAVLAGVLAFLLFFTGTAAVPLIGRDEPRFAEAAREMLARGDLVVPTFGGIDRYDKPILVYWCTMASYAVLGVTERAARLPSNLAGALLAALLAFWARRRWGPFSGVTAGLLLAVTLTFHLESRACTADLVTLLPATAAMLALLALLDGRGGAGAAAVFWAGMALSILGKGPVGPMLAIGTGAGLWGLARQWRRWEIVLLGALAVAGWAGLGPKVLAVPAVWALVETLRDREARARLARLRWWWGIPLMLLLTLPWAVTAWHATGGAFFRVGVGKHVVARSLEPLESHGGLPGFYLLTGLIAAFPWFAFGPAAVSRWWRERATNVEIRFLLAWLLGPLAIIEMVETKLVHYWMGSYPAAVLLVVAWLWTDRETAARWRSPRWLIAAGSLLVALVPLGVTVHLHLVDLVPIAAGLTAVLLAGAAWAAVSWARAPRRALAILVMATALFELGLFGGLMPRLGQQLVGPKAARRMLEIRRPGETLVIYKARDDELFFELPLDARNVRPRQELARLVEEGRPFLGIARNKDLEQFRKEHPGLAIRTVERIPGVDLGHGRWVEMALFRPGGAESP